MSTDVVERLADSATEGLKDDTELRLDVRQELVSHIEESVADCREDGMSEEQSVAEGVKAFGPATDIAAELVSANRSRMRIRQLVRLAMRALIVPASLMVALWIQWGTVATGNVVKQAFAFDGDRLDDDYMKKALCLDEMSEDAAFLFFGDSSLETDLERQRSIWERHPTNRIFFGNYITVLMANRQLNDMDDLRYFEQEIRRGERLDPKNARYNYLLAALMIEMASEIEDVASDDDKEETVFKVKDRALLDRAMAEMLKGGEKPFMDTYSTRMQALRGAELPEERSIAQRVARMVFFAGTFIPNPMKHRTLARTSSEYARLLIEEGKKKEAIPYLEACLPLAHKSFENGETLVESLVAFVIAGMASNNAAVLQSIGEPERAAKVLACSEAVTAVSRAYRARVRNKDNNMDELITKHGSILQTMLMAVSGAEDITEEDLAPGRTLEQTLIERGWLASFVGCLLVVMLGFFLVSLCLRFARGGESAPLLLLPDAAQTLRVITYAVLIPLGVFFIYTRHTDLAGRDLSMRIWPRFVAELYLLAVIMLSVAAHQMQKLVNVRCQQLGLESPGKRNYFVILLFSFLPLGLIAWTAAGRQKSAMFRGTVARSMIPVLALIIILVGTVVHPYLLNREKRFVQNDRILGTPKEGGVTWIETLVTERLNREALEAMTSTLP
jgi:hypothetical protein